MLFLAIFVMALSAAPLLVQISIFKSSLPSSLLSVIPALAIPADQAAAVLSTWAIPTYSKDISNLVSDFAGNAYFSESSTNKIGRLEPATNMITEWTLPNNSSKPGLRFISFDSDSRNVYFVENNGNTIGRLEPTKNTFTEWTLPTMSSNILTISPSFGGIYFAESSTNKIGRLEPATNMITEWTLHNNSSKPAGVAFDPSSGSIYFAESSTNKIGRLVPATNVITEWN